MEIWKAVVGAEGFYEVSNLGRVRSLPREVCAGRAGKRVVGGSILKTRTHEFGYPMVTLSINGKPISRTVHSLIAEAFIGPRLEGLQVRHKDGDPSRSILENIEYGTPKQNMSDKIDHGTQPRGEQIYCAKLKESDIVSIRTRRAAGEKLISIAEDYGVTEVYIHHICTGEKWSSAPGPITEKRRKVKILDEEERLEVKRMRSDGFSLKKIANHFDVSVTQICNIVGK